MEKNPGGDLLLRDLSSDYHWRGSVSLPGSERDRVGPVSYTHLAGPCGEEPPAWSSPALWLSCSNGKALFVPFLPGPAIFGMVAASAFSFPLRPVSYTHLDVYKRQVQPWA